MDLEFTLLREHRETSELDSRPPARLVALPFINSPNSLSLDPGSDWDLRHFVNTGRRRNKVVGHPTRLVILPNLLFSLSGYKKNQEEFFFAFLNIFWGSKRHLSKSSPCRLLAKILFQSKTLSCQCVLGRGR